jgi:hypothetical protein
LKFGDLTIPITLETMALYSRRIHELYLRGEYPPQGFEVTSKVQCQSVIEFVHACQVRDYELSLGTALDLLRLCAEFDVFCIKRDVENFILKNSQPLLIDWLECCFDLGLDTASIESQLRDNFFDYADNPKLAKFPLSFLARVVQSSDTHSSDPSKFGRTFDLLIHAYRHHGPSASILFHGLDLNLLTAPQLTSLQSLKGLNWLWFGNFLADTLTNTMNSRIDHEYRISQLECSISALSANAAQFPHVDSSPIDFDISTIQSDHRNLLQQYNELRTEIRELKEAMSRVTTDLDHIHTKISQERACPYEGGNSTDGVIAYLTSEHNGNIHDKRIVTITAKSEACPARNLADLKSQKYFCSHQAPNQWIKWDFGRMIVQLTHYAMITRTGCVNPTSWILQGSTDDKEWTELDKREAFTDWSGDEIVRVFPVAEGTGKGWTMFRLTQIGKNDRTEDALLLYGVEFFGSLRE